MIPKHEYERLRRKLESALERQLEDAQVQISDDLHYRGTNLVITSKQFRGLLPEQRYYLAVRAIPSDLYERYLRGGVVWFELAPGESGREYMRMPRSDDVEAQVPALYRRLNQIRFFQTLQRTLEERPADISTEDLSWTRQILIDAGVRGEELTRCLLFFIRHGGFTDALVVADVIPELAGEHAA